MVPAKTPIPFGVRAVAMGFVTAEQVEKALAVQKTMDKGGQHRMIGMIMVDLEMLSTTQLLSILRSYATEAADSQ